MSLTVTDLFCGAGGSSIGAERAGGTLRLGLNHWERAIETHATNFEHAPLAKATRERIRRGLERLAKEPFAIRLLQSGNPKPLTLPLVTLTGRHDMAMVMPVAGNTFERTPGNRARRSDTQPLDTVHGTLDRALVLSNRANNVPRKADEEPTHPVLTGEHIGVVVPQEKHTTPRVVDRDPVHTVKAGGQHHGLVMRNNRGGAEMSTPTHEPIRTLTSGCHQSLLVPYNGSEARNAETEPSVTLHTRDPLAIAVGDDDIDSCRFRMFELGEIARAMAMHEHVDGGEYVVLGNKRERMAQYGNAVTPPAMYSLVARCLEVLG